MIRRPGQFVLTEDQLGSVRAQFIRLVAVFSMLLGAMVLIAELTHEHFADEPGHITSVLIAGTFIIAQGVTLGVLHYRGLRPASIVTVILLVAFSFAVEFTLAEE